LRQEELDGAALTFDDGPHPHGTVSVLETLREHDAKATFFLAGEQVERRPALAAEIVAAGHRVELHCYRHRNQLRLTPRMLLHDADYYSARGSWVSTAAALSKILELLEARGLKSRLLRRAGAATTVH